MKLKSKLRLALELGLVTSALPLLLLGCGGGSSGGSSDGRVQGQFWTDLTSATGVHEFYPGYAAVSGVFGYDAGYYAYGYVSTATFSGGNYNMSSMPKEMTAGSGWGSKTLNYYYLAASGGWTPYSFTTSLHATDAAHYAATDVIYGAMQGSITTINLSGLPIVASSAVPAVTALGMASAVSPASAFYPSGSYEFVTETTYVASKVYMLWANPELAVTTNAGQMTNLLSLTGYRSYNTAGNPLCMFGYGFVNTTGDTYNVYKLTFSGPMPAGTPLTCPNATIAAGASLQGTYALSSTTVNGTPLIGITNPTGTLSGDLLIGISPADGKAYTGGIFPAETTSATAHMLNKTAMDAALTAWGMPTF